MNQTQARALAKARQGIATTAKPKPNGGWTFGGWTDSRSVWVVVLPWGDVVSEVEESK